MDVEIVPTLKTAVHGVSNGSTPMPNLGSNPEQVQVGECFDQEMENKPGFYMTDISGHEINNSNNNENPINMEDVQELSDYEKSEKKQEKDKKRAMKSGTLMNNQCVKYELPHEKEGEFAVFDLVWGKVKSHPWWPGQIFHPSDSSEKAMKYYKKDCYLVAYFGDRTFAWNDGLVLKPFRNHFSHEERQSNSESFQNAVNCALEEVSRRVELGLSCSCISDQAYDRIKYQKVENSGIREGSSKREGVDRSMGSDSFQPRKLTEYIRALALFPTSGVDRLEVVIAKAQLLAFNHLRGYDSLPEFEYYEGLLEFEPDSRSEDRGGLSHENGEMNNGSRKRKHDLRDIVYKRRKEKTVLELMGDTMYYLDGDFESYDDDDDMASHTKNVKRRPSGFFTDDFTSPLTTHESQSQSQQSFKVGERIRRAAFQMSGSPKIIKDDKHSGDDDDINESLESKTLENMLSQLHLCAQNPKKGYSFLGEIITFFSGIRNLAVTTHRKKIRKRKKKSFLPSCGSPETFKFDDENDSYWTDMVIEGNTEPKTGRRGRKKDKQVLSVDNKNPPERKPRKYTRKKDYLENHGSISENPTRDEKHLDLPAELVLKFGETGSVPSEVNLNKMFKCFGPLKESLTEADSENGSARIVFKKGSDAEVAYSSATTVNIFGSMQVKYQINYTPSNSLGSSALALSNGNEGAT